MPKSNPRWADMNDSDDESPVASFPGLREKPAIAEEVSTPPSPPSPAELPAFLKPHEAGQRSLRERYRALGQEVLRGGRFNVAGVADNSQEYWGQMMPCGMPPRPHECGPTANMAPGWHMAPSDQNQFSMEGGWQGFVGDVAVASMGMVREQQQCVPMHSSMDNGWQLIAPPFMQATTPAPYNAPAFAEMAAPAAYAEQIHGMSSMQAPSPYMFHSGSPMASYPALAAAPFGPTGALAARAEKPASKKKPKNKQTGYY